MRLVKRRSHEIVHAGIDDEECLARPWIEVQHARDEHAGIAHDQSPRLVTELDPEVSKGSAHHVGVGVDQVRAVREILRNLVRDAKTATEIEPLNGMALGAQTLSQAAQAAECVLETVETDNLAADVNRQSHHADARHVGCLGVDALGVREADPELIALRARGYLGVSACANIGIDA